MKLPNPIHSTLLCLAVLLTLALLGCRTENPSTPAQDEETKAKVANATAEAKERGQEAVRKLDEATKGLQHKAKVAAEGIKEGWERGGASPSQPLDLNTASVKDLARLPGLSSRDAQRIVDGRPYQNKHDLVTRKIISAEKYSKLDGRITVK